MNQSTGLQSGAGLRARSWVERVDTQFQSCQFPAAGKNTGNFFAKCGHTRMFAGCHENRQGMSREFREFRRNLLVMCSLQPNSQPLRRPSRELAGKIGPHCRGQTSVRREDEACNRELCEACYNFFSTRFPHRRFSAQIAPLAQLDRASDYESEGREFESLRARHYPSPSLASPTPPSCSSDNRMPSRGSCPDQNRSAVRSPPTGASPRYGLSLPWRTMRTNSDCCSEARPSQS